MNENQMPSETDNKKKGRVSQYFWSLFFLGIGLLGLYLRDSDWCWRATLGTWAMVVIGVHGLYEAVFYPE